MKLRQITLAVSCSLLWIAGCSETQPPSGTPLRSLAVPGPAGHGTNLPEYRLRLRQLHTGESIDVVYRVGQEYVASAVVQLDHFLRDYRTGEDAHYPMQEFDLLHALMGKLGRPDGVIEIVCGYRTPWSNNFLRTRSSNTGVAEHSQHMLSHAIDLRIPGVTTERIRDAAVSLHMGGVGYYPRSGFVHVDVGPVRQWSFGATGRSVAATAHTHAHHHPRLA